MYSRGPSKEGAEGGHLRETSKEDQEGASKSEPSKRKPLKTSTLSGEALN
jgi:hypothetical protein